MSTILPAARSFFAWLTKTDDWFTGWLARRVAGLLVSRLTVSSYSYRTLSCITDLFRLANQGDGQDHHLGGGGDGQGKGGERPHLTKVQHSARKLVDHFSTNGRNEK